MFSLCEIIHEENMPLGDASVKRFLLFFYFFTNNG